MDYHSTKYSFGELSEHINRLESKFQLNNLYGKDAFLDTSKQTCDQNILSLNQKGFRNGFSLVEDQNFPSKEKTSFENLNSITRCENSKSDDMNEKYRSDRMKPEEETNYIVKLEKMSADELLYSRKLSSDIKDKKTTGEQTFTAACNSH